MVLKRPISGRVSAGGSCSLIPSRTLSKEVFRKPTRPCFGIQCRHGMLSERGVPIWFSRSPFHSDSLEEGVAKDPIRLCRPVEIPDPGIKRLRGTKAGRNGGGPYPRDHCREGLANKAINEIWSAGIDI